MRRSSTSVRSGLAACLAAVALAAVLLPGAGAASSASPELRPDLVQRTPSGVEVRSTRSGGHRIGFDSAVENRGAGPLRVYGRRGPTARDMTAEQRVKRADGTTAVRAGVGTIRYTRSGGHDHWHLLRFDRYELRRASDHALVRPDRKTGFCLGDRYDSGYPAPAKPRQPVLNTRCRLYEPGARSLAMGISVGYGDDYRAYLEGQSIAVDGLPAGRYELVHRVNGNRRLLERNYANNAASVLVDLRWPGGAGAKPTVEVLKRCPGTERCAPNPP